MIYLIGGACRVGKSTLAKIIFEQHRIPYIPTDILRGSLYNHLNRPMELWAERPEFFFTYLKDFIQRANRAYPNGCVIEGDIFLPSQIASIGEDWIKCAFLGASHITVEQIKLCDPNDWVHRLAAERQAGLAESIMINSKLIESEAANHKFAYFDIHPDRNAALEDARKYLLGNHHHEPRHS